MPPPPPNFVPINRRQRLDPTRRLQSRELWNKVRYHSSAHKFDNTSSNNDHGSSSKFSNNIQWAISLLRAIAYEIQPFRIKPALHSIKRFISNENDENGATLKQIFTTIIERLTSMLYFIQKLLQLLNQQIKKFNLQSTIQFVSTYKSSITKSTFLLFALRLYYKALLYLHDLLHIGPVLIICTLLVLLYTIGLGDNTGAQSGIPSAYSVFNRGMRRIMGTVDGEELARQYAGGMAAAGGDGMNHNDDDDGYGIIWEENNQDEVGEEEEEEQNLINERRRQKRLERLQQRRVEEDGAQNDNTDAQLPEQDENDVTQQQQQDEAAAVAVARKSSKKARRQNLEVRREMQRQRQAAAGLGFGNGDDIDDDAGVFGLGEGQHGDDEPLLMMDNE